MFCIPSIVFFWMHVHERETGIIESIRDDRTREIIAIVDRIEGDLKTMSRLNDLYAPARELCVGARPAGTAPGALSWVLNSYLENNSVYREIFIVSARTGRTVYSTDSKGVGIDFLHREYLVDSGAGGDIAIRGIYFSSRLNIPTMTIALPLGPSGLGAKKPFGLLVARINLERSIYGLLLEHDDLDKSGEIQLVNRDLSAMSPLRGQNGYLISKKLRDEASLASVRGGSGVAMCRDYRGKMVLAAYRRIPRLGWGIVVKKDADEAYGPVYTLLSLMAGLSIALAAAVFFAARGVAVWISAPMKSVARAAERISDGDYTARSLPFGNDEIGAMAASFNRMTEIIVSQLNVQKISSDIIQVMVSTLSLDEFSRSVLRKFVEVTESSVGAFYMLSPDGREFNHVTSIGLDIGSLETFHAGRLEGEFGRVLATREIAVTRNISEKSMVRMRTIIGDIVPKEIMTIPVIVSNRTVAIISLATLTEYPVEVATILNQVRPVMNTAFSNILSDEESRRLAKELSEKNQLLENQKEELITQARELKHQSERVQKQNTELENQRLKVEEANKLKTEFLSNMSHELRTPLNSIVALSHVLILQGKDRLTDEEMEYLEIIDRNGGKLLSLINDILDLSKIEAGRIDLKIKPLSLVGIVRVIVDNLEQIAEDKGIGLKLVIEGDIPHIESDESRVYQILQNIIGNAVKFTERGGVTITVSSEESGAAVSVDDTGIGIDPRELPHIFEEFRQIDGTLTRRYEGTGLGLAIASKSAQLISGTISVSSKVGTGTRFEILFPVEWRDPEELDERELNNLDIKRDVSVPLSVLMAGDSAAAGRTWSSSRTRARSVLPKVLVVDDDSDNILAVRAVLRERYRVCEAHDGNEAVAMVFSERPDLILLDMALPEKNGFIVARELKENRETRSIPCIALTALTMSGDREKTIEAGCDDYIPKPFTVQDLTEKIRFWLREK